MITDGPDEVKSVLIAVAKVISFLLFIGVVAAIPVVYLLKAFL